VKVGNVRSLTVNQQLEAPMSRHRGAHRKPRHRAAPALAAAGVVALGLSVSAAPAGAAETTAAPAASPVGGTTTASPAADTPPRVTGFSNFFDYCQTGSTLAIPFAYGIGTSLLNLALAQFPAEAQPLTNQVLVGEAAGPQLFDQMAGPSREFIDGGRTAVAPLAAYNEQFNTGLHSMAEGTRTFAKAVGPLVQPGDVSMYQFADFLDSLQAK
jgi:hypothetical protein